MSADVNGDGHIDNGEFTKMMKAMGHNDVTEEKINMMIEAGDTDKDGRISWLEYIDCYGSCKGNFASGYEDAKVTTLD